MNTDKKSFNYLETSQTSIYGFLLIGILQLSNQLEMLIFMSFFYGHIAIVAPVYTQCNYVQLCQWQMITLNYTFP